MATTRVSSKGQVIIPKDVRERRGWATGTELAVEERDGAVLLRPVKPFGRPTTIDEVYGCLKYDGPTISIEEMDEAVMREAKNHA